jgi:hypothetical protein
MQTEQGEDVTDLIAELDALAEKAEQAHREYEAGGSMGLLGDANYEFMGALANSWPLIRARLKRLEAAEKLLDCVFSMDDERPTVDDADLYDDWMRLRGESDDG